MEPEDVASRLRVAHQRQAHRAACDQQRLACWHDAAHQPVEELELHGLSKAGGPGFGNGAEDGLILRWAFERFPSYPFRRGRRGALCSCHQQAL